jgi:hypothetical protein
VSDLILRLANLAHGAQPLAQPRPVSRFEPATGAREDRFGAPAPSDEFAFAEGVAHRSAASGRQPGGPLPPAGPRPVSAPRDEPSRTSALAPEAPPAQHTRPEHLANDWAVPAAPVLLANAASRPAHSPAEPPGVDSTRAGRAAPALQGPANPEPAGEAWTVQPGSQFATTRAEHVDLGVTHARLEPRQGSPLLPIELPGRRLPEVDRPTSGSGSTVQIHIGRIEIRTGSRQPQAKRERAAEGGRPMMSLEDYLRGSAGGRG